MKHDVFEYLRAEKFIKDFCPNVTNIKHKLRGYNGRGNPMDFTESDKKEIKAALARFAAILKTYKQK